MGYLVCILLYIAGIIIYGIVMGKKKVKTSDDFVVAGRQLPFMILIGTLLASWCGGGGITGSASVVYLYGPVVGTLHFAGAPIGMLLLYFISSKVRSSTKITVPEVFAARYGDGASIIAVICIMLAYVGLCATQIKAAGNIISLITGMDANLATVLSAVGILLLTVSGGMISVAYTDAVSALLMVGGFLLAIPMLIGKAGGWSEAMAAIPAERLTGTGGLGVIAILGYMIPTISLLLGDQNMMQRFASAKSAEEAKKSNLGLFAAEITVCVLIILMCTIGINYAFVVNHRGPSGEEITDTQIYDVCNRGLSALKELGILPDTVKDVEPGTYDAVLYSAIDVLEPRNNVAVWKLEMSNIQKNADKENHLINAYIDADDGKMYEFYVRTPRRWEEMDPDRIMETWSSYMGLVQPRPYDEPNPLMETTPYFKKYVCPGAAGEHTIVTVGFYEGINELIYTEGAFS